MNVYLDRLCGAVLMMPLMLCLTVLLAFFLLLARRGLRLS